MRAPLQHTATHCNTLQHTATHCITLRHTTTGDFISIRAHRCGYNMVLKCAESCNALQRTATHRNTLQQVISFPYAYHCGFNVALNCAESCNFASEKWVPYGLKVKSCKCFDDSGDSVVQRVAGCYSVLQCGACSSV